MIIMEIGGTSIFPLSYDVMSQKLHDPRSQASKIFITEVGDEISQRLASKAVLKRSYVRPKLGQRPKLPLFVLPAAETREETAAKPLSAQLLPKG